MAIDHASLSGNQLHEPKGASTAAIGTVYTADGQGSGAWQSPLAGLNNSNLIYLTVQVPNLSASSSVFVVSPLAGRVTSVDTVLNGAITGTSPIITGKINGVPIGGLGVTLTAAGSFAGQVFSGIPTSANVLAAKQAVEIDCSGAATGTSTATVTLTINVS